MSSQSILGTKTGQLAQWAQKVKIRQVESHWITIGLWASREPQETIFKDFQNLGLDLCEEIWTDIWVQDSSKTIVFPQKTVSRLPATDLTFIDILVGRVSVLIGLLSWEAHHICMFCKAGHVILFMPTYPCIQPASQSVIARHQFLYASFLRVKRDDCVIIPFFIGIIKSVKEEEMN